MTDEERTSYEAVKEWLVNLIKMRGPMRIPEAVRFGRGCGYTERQVRDAVMGEADWETAGRLQIGDGMKLEPRL